MGLAEIARGLGYEPFESAAFVWRRPDDGTARFMVWKQGYVAAPREAALILSEAARRSLLYRRVRDPRQQRSAHGDERMAMAFGFTKGLRDTTLERIAHGRYEECFAQDIDAAHRSYQLVPGRLYRFELVELSANDPITEALTPEQVYHLFPERLGRALNLREHAVPVESYETGYPYGSFGVSLDDRGLRGTSEDVMLGELFSSSPSGVIIPTPGFDIAASLLDRAIAFGPEGPLADRIALESEHLNGALASEFARDLYHEHPFATAELDAPAFGAALKRFRARLGTN